MVMSNMGLPEPPSSETTITANNELIIPTESDSDDEDGAVYDGYERLPMNPINEPVSDNDTDEDDDPVEEATNDGGVPEIETMDVSLAKDVWSATASKDIDMDNDKVNLVKEAMVNFTLPASSIPEWANNIPEDQWKEHILKRLENK